MSSSSAVYQQAQHTALQTVLFPARRNRIDCLTVEVESLAACNPDLTATWGSSQLAKAFPV
jgi:hypothetical protein